MEDFISERRLEAFNFLRENPDCGWLSAREFEGSHPFSARTGAGANAASSQPLLNWTQILHLTLPRNFGFVKELCHIE
jgi:hypothetical protein